MGLYSNAPGLDRISNFGTIQGSAAGVTLRYADAVLINGSSTDREALIAGGYGIFAYDRAQSGSVTITNFGTIKGADGVAVKLTGAGDELIAEAGSTFIGAIEGGAGLLALAGGETGIITGLGGEGTLSGAVDADFTGFASYEIAVGGTWTLAGSNVLNAGAALVDRGALINRGALTSSGTLSVAASAVFTLDGGAISAGPTGAARIVDYGLMLNSAGTGRTTVGAHMFDQGVVEAATGALDFTDRLFGTGALKIDGEATLEADAGSISTLSVDFDGPAATLALKSARTFDASLHGLSVGDIIDLLAAKATGASVDESDKLVIVDGARIVASLQLSGNYAGATFTTSSDGHGGTDVTLTSAADANLPSIHRMAAAMACLAPAPGVALPRRDLATNHAPVLATPLVQIS